MTITGGMDIEAVRNLGNTLKQKANEIQSIIDSLNPQISGVEWNGKDSDMFKNQWWPEHRTTLLAVKEKIDGLGQSALNNASAQEGASNS